MKQRDTLSTACDVALALFLAWAAAVNTLAFRGYHFEDAYITFRYAANLAAGEGFVFNLGERVLGTSTPLYTLLLAALASLGLDVVESAGLLYGLCLSLCGWFGFWLLRLQGYPGAGAIFALAAVWGPGGVLHFFGMETALYLMLIFLALLAARLPTARWTTGLILGLVATTRYDGLVVGLVVLLWCWSRGRRLPWREAVAFGAVLGAWLLFATLYFGSPLPNTLAAKTAVESFTGYLGGAVELQVRFFPTPLHRFWEGRPIAPWVPPLLTLLFALPALFGARRWLPRLWPLPAVAVLLWLGYGMIGPPVGHRWYLTPALYLLLAVGLVGWGELLHRWGRGETAAVLALTVAGAVLLPAAAQREARALIDSPAQRIRVDAYDRLIVWMRHHGLDGATLLTNEPGYLAYHTGQPAIDGAGLVTEGVYLHQPERRTPLAELVGRYRPQLIVYTTDLGILERAVRGYLPIYQAQPTKLLLIRRDVYERHFDRLYERWLERRFDPPGSTLGRGHPIAVDFEDNPTPGWNHDLGNRLFVGRPLPGLRFDGRPVADRYLHTFGRRREKVSSLWSDPFPIDFDELTFRFAASSRQWTRAQLFAGGLPVLEVGGRGTEPPVEMEQVVMPVYPWRGQLGVLRFVDADRQGGFLAADGVTSRRYDGMVVVDDFESGTYGELWEQGFGDVPTPTRELARRHGLQLAQGRYAAASLGRPGRQALVSRPFVLAGDHLCFTVFDFGGRETSVNLWVGGRKVQRFRGRRTRRPVTVRWDVGRFRGQEAILRVVDRGEGAGEGIGIDSIVLADGFR